MKKKVSIITVHYNEPAMTERLLRALAPRLGDEMEWIVVDNGSEPARSLEPFVARFPSVRFLFSEENLGFAGGNALALPHASGQYLFFLNNDAVPEPEAIGLLADFLDSHPKAGAVSPLLVQRAGAEARAEVLYAGKTRVHPLTGRNRTLGEKSFDPEQWRIPFRTHYVHGAAMMVRREVVRSVGFMDAAYFLYYEELDWGERMRRAGWELWVVPQARVWHDESHTVGKGSPLKVFFQTRNRWRFMWRNQRVWQALIFSVWFFGIALPARFFAEASRGRKQHLQALWDAVCWIAGSRRLRAHLENRWKPGGGVACPPDSGASKR